MKRLKIAGSPNQARDIKTALIIDGPYVDGDIGICIGEDQEDPSRTAFIKPKDVKRIVEFLIDHAYGRPDYSEDLKNRIPNREKEGPKVKGSSPRDRIQN